MSHPSVATLLKIARVTTDQPSPPPEVPGTSWIQNNTNEINLTSVLLEIETEQLEAGDISYTNTFFLPRELPE